MKKKGFTLIELLAVIIILALILIIAIPRIMDAVREARVKSFENDILAIYKTMEKAVHEFELNVPEGRENDYADYFSDEHVFPDFDYEWDNDGLYPQYAWVSNECPTEFWASSKEHCQYYYDPTIGVESLFVVVHIPKGIQPLYNGNDKIINGGSYPVCQAMYAPTWKFFVEEPILGGHYNIPEFYEGDTGFFYLLCQQGG